MHNDIPAPMQTFLNEMYLIITHKVIGDAWFNSNTGICNNWYSYCEYHRVPKHECIECNRWLYAQFDGMAYPFDRDNAILYIRDKRRGTLYDNTYRRAFIERHATV